MFTRLFILGAFLLTANFASAQGIMGDVFSGKLLNPEVGVYSWYDLTDTATGNQYYLRLAIVGEEKVKNKAGHWFEVELVPRVGFPAVYKMLLTGPASDPQNVHRILMKEGTSEVVELDTAALAGGSEQSAGAVRSVIGEDEVETAIGTVIAEHVLSELDGKKTDIWLNNEVLPMGLVKIKNDQGEMVLRNYGKGGPQAESAMDRTVLPEAVGSDTITVTPSVEDGTVDEAAEENPEMAEPVETLSNEDISDTDIKAVEPAEEMPEEVMVEPAPAAETAGANVISTGDTAKDKETIADEAEKKEEEGKAKSRRPVRGGTGRPR